MIPDLGASFADDARIEPLRGLNSGDIWRYPAFDSH